MLETVVILDDEGPVELKLKYAQALTGSGHVLVFTPGEDQTKQQLAVKLDKLGLVSQLEVVLLITAPVEEDFRNFFHRYGIVTEPLLGLSRREAKEWLNARV